MPMLLRTFLILTAFGGTSAFAQTLGNLSFFSDVKSWMQSNSTDVYLTKLGDARIIVFDANGYKMDTYMTSTTGDTIVDAVEANPDAEFIINGSLFNQGSNRSTGPFFSPTGNVVRQGSVIWDISGKPGDAAASLRYWLGQTKDTSAAKNAGSAASYVFGGKGHPTGVGTGANDIYTAHGGLVSLIWEKGGSPHKQTAKDDSDLKTYGALKFGFKKGYGVIGVDRDTGLLVIAVKNNWDNGSVYLMQEALFDSGVDRALLVDGAGSIGLYLKSHNFYIKASNRHGTPDRMDTIPSYITFKKND